jgi:hypothetical protein
LTPDRPPGSRKKKAPETKLPPAAAPFREAPGNNVLWQLPTQMQSETQRGNCINSDDRIARFFALLHRQPVAIIPQR